MTDLPGHLIEQVIRELPGARRVLRTRFRGVTCVSRVLLGARVDPELGPQIARAALHGRGSLAGIPEEVLLTLEGYVVAARLPQPDPRWPQALGAGVTAGGHVWVTTRWVEGTPLHQVTGPLPPEARRGVALGVLEILAQLHAHHVAHGDLKPENIVLGPDGELSIIDLDTLREVAGEQAWAVTRDITRSWAAPEQEQQRRTFLASDLWGWARLVRTLFPEGAPPDWLPALRACQLGDPLRRPHTMRLLSALHDPGEPLLDWLERPTPPEGAEPAPLAGAASVSTERVPEASAVGTERVPDAGTGPRSIPSAALPQRRRVPSFVVIALAFVVSPITLCGGGTLWWDHQNVKEANRLAEGAMAALKAHKINPALNQKSQRAPLLAMAEEAWRTRKTPRSSAVRALALVWAEGWQDSGKKWDAAAFAEAREAIEKVEDSRQPEALLALGTLYAAACRLNRADATAQASCERALAALDELQRRLPEGAEHHWLRVEGAWTEVLVRGDLATRLESSGSPEAQAQLDAAVARCDEADPWFAWAPVNGPELLQDCLRMDGLAGRMDRYLHHGDLLVAADRQDGTLERATLQHVYQAAGTGCDAVSVKPLRGGWDVRGPDWCLAAGHAARGCYGDALTVALAGSIYDPDRPWESLWKAIPQGAGTERCVR